MTDKQIEFKAGFGGRIKQYRKRKKLTLTDMAESIGLSPAELSRIENEKRNPSQETLFTLLRETRINPKWLLIGEGEMILVPFTQAEAVFGRLMKVLNVKSRDKVEEELGLVPGYLSLSYMADPTSALPHEAIIRYCIEREINLDWIYTGKGKPSTSRKKDKLHIDPVFLKEITKTVEKYLQKEETRLTSKQKTELTTLLYDELSTDPSKLEDEPFVNAFIAMYIKVRTSLPKR